MHRFDVKTIRNVQWRRKYWKQCKTTKLIKVQRIASIWCQNDQNNSKLQTRSNYDQFASIWHQNNEKCWDTSQNIQYNAKLRKWSNYSALHRFDVKTITNVQWRRKYWKQCKTTKLIKVKRIASIWCQNDKNNSKLQTRSNYYQFASIWRQNDKKVQWRLKIFNTMQNYKTDQITMDSIDLSSKQSKMLRYVAKHSKQRKPTKVIKLYCIASIWRLNDQIFWVTSLNYKSNQITMDCIDLTSKQSKMLRYVAKHSKQRKPTKVIKWYCIASIWRLNDQNFWVTSLNYKSNQITMDCIDLTSKRSKTLRYGRKTFKTT